MEILSGARDEAQARQLRRMLNAWHQRAVSGADFEEAARIYRDCRRAGKAVRSLTNCLIAAVAIRGNMSVLAHDRDFETIAELTELTLDANT
jgi:predicted nucleic acid-binding protein